MTIVKDKLISFCTGAARKAGLSAGDAEILADVLVTNDQRGVHSHGCVMLRGYLNSIKQGGTDPRAEISMEIDTPAYTLVNGNNGQGVIVSYKAMKYAIEKARKSGVAVVGVKNSTHCAAAGYYPMMCAEQFMIGVFMSNGDPVMSIPGTVGRVMGNNPFAYAAPSGDGGAVFFDVAMSVIAGSKVKGFETEGKTLPPNWLIDKEGYPSTDPSDFVKGGTLLPFAMHKGYGFAVMVEILAAILTGAGTMNENVDWVANPGVKNNIGHFMIVINIASFMDPGVFSKRMDKMCDELRSAKKAPGYDRIYTPGEIELDCAARQSEFLSLPLAVSKSLEMMADEWGMVEEFDYLRK